MTIVYLIRHGQTYFNRYNKMQGWSDSPLTEQGIADAKRVGEIFKNTHFQYTCSSDANRARNTVRVILEQNKANSPRSIEIPDFRECFYGFFEGMNASEAWIMSGHLAGCHTYNEIINKFNLDKTKDLMHEADPFKDAETANQYWQRIERAFKTLASKIDFSTADPVLLVTHGTTIRSIAGRYGINQGFDITDSPRNGSITTIEINSKSEIDIKDYNKLNI
ncbi:histidine phosphatase family protein [Xylocopilactobacillus apis]|uniref:Phosphoglycerate mutase n=1 Tax=Xylocopilactobacillus apis TaxID=2932183 RepID=A0AAU9D2F6_9LACO|nr:histidine phosphatase family protein [Xylocopilactobacillus apis]BDR56666.1 phosphoglycerate mutase [Xylocopilactobacillus apis]